MMTIAEQMTTDDDDLAQLLAHGLSYQEAADRLNVSKSTVARRMEKISFRVRVDELREIRLEEILAALRSGAEESIAHLRQVLKNEQADQNLRLKAAIALLNASARAPAPTPTKYTPQEARQLLYERLVEIAANR